MHVQRTRHDRDFTIIPNAIARNRGLSFTARGILVHLLSLPSGARVDVKTLADQNPGVGRKGVANALDELVAAGYYVRHTGRDPKTGRVRTETAVYDTPQGQEEPAVSPLPASPGTGEPADGKAGTLPTGVKELGCKDLENPSPSPSVQEPAVEAPVAAREGSSESQDLRQAVAVLARLEDADRRLRLSRKDLLRLAPLAARWLERNVPATELVDAVVQGLPPTVYSPARLVADRLTRKLPEPRRTWARYAECGQCRNPLPAGQSSGICAGCAGVAPAVPSEDPEALSAFVSARASAVRAAMRAARSAVAMA